MASKLVQEDQAQILITNLLEIDPVRCSMNYVLYFLAYSFEMRLTPIDQQFLSTMIMGKIFQLGNAQKSLH